MASTVPEIYKEREPAYIKHTLLESYLETLVLTVGMGAKGEAQARDLLRRLLRRTVGIRRREPGRHVDRLVTQDAGQLQGQTRVPRRECSHAGPVHREGQEGVRASVHVLEARDLCRSGAQVLPSLFVDLRHDILTWCGTNSFTFFFITPRGGRRW